MVAAFVRIAPWGSVSALDQERLQDRLIANASAADLAEFIRVRAGPEHADILAFFDLTDPGKAYETLRLIVQRTLASLPDLSQWRVV